MLNRPSFRYPSQCGVTLLEVLITIIILAFGLLGLAGLQGKIQLAEVESFQRGQAILLLNDMVERISASRATAASYVAASSVGTGDSQSTSCTSLAAGQPRDTCEWSNALKGASEQQSGVGAVGTLKDGRGCISQVQLANVGTCTPAIYRVTVVWQGLHQTTAPASAVTCGQGSYGADSYRRAISAQILVGLPRCIP